MENNNKSERERACSGEWEGGREYKSTDKQSVVSSEWGSALRNIQKVDVVPDLGAWLRGGVLIVYRSSAALHNKPRLQRLFTLVERA